VIGIAGLKVGHATDARLKSGVTVFLPDAPAIAAVHVVGGAPATRETDLLAPGNLVERVDAIVLSGGSAFGLAAADGVAAWLAAAGRGFAIGDVRVPIVPAACLFDLLNGGDKKGVRQKGAVSIYAGLGEAGCATAVADAAVGSVGAGAGATVADLKGGFGAAATTLPDGARLAAFAAANAVGRVTLGATPHFRAAPFEQDDEFGGLGMPSQLPRDAAAVFVKGSAALGANTTLAVVATDCDLTRAEAKRLAIAAHDGLALAIFPAHTPFDGDTIFTMATGSRPLGADRPRALAGLCAAAAATLARAVARAVYAAEPAEGDRLPTWRQRYGDEAPSHAT
jgi:L-aminopeptidase/D-esterase-like protein